MPHERTLKRIRENLNVLLVEFVEQAVFDTASEPSREPASKSGLLPCAEERWANNRCASGIGSLFHESAFSGHPCEKTTVGPVPQSL